MLVLIVCFEANKYDDDDDDGKLLIISMTVCSTYQVFYKPYTRVPYSESGNTPTTVPNAMFSFRSHIQQTLFHVFRRFKNFERFFVFRKLRHFTLAYDQSFYHAFKQLFI